MKKENNESTINSESRIAPPDPEIEQLRAMLAGASEQADPKGVRKFFHHLAERFATPQKKVIMQRVQETPPAKKDAA